MKIQITKNIKRQFIVYAAVTAFAIATPKFDSQAEAEEPSGFFFMLEGRASFSEGDSTTWAEGGTLQQGFMPNGNLLTIDTDLARWSGRAGAGYHTGSWDFGVLYSGLQTLNQDRRSHDSLYFGLLGVSYTFPGYESLAESTVTYNVVDFEAGFNVQLGQVDARIFGGLRFAEIDQNVNGILTPRPGLYPCNPYSVFDLRMVDFTGVGPRLGARVGVPISGSIGMIASASGAALFGDQDTITIRGNQGGPIVTPTRVDRNDDKTVWNVDGELGVTYERKVSGVASIILTLGYRAEVWFDVNNTQSEPPTLSGNIYGTMDADQIFHGPFLRGVFQFD